MDDMMFRIVACLVTTSLFCIATIKLLGAMQQANYKNQTFWRWLKRKDNLYFNRLTLLSLCLLFSSAVTSLCFSFLGKRMALLLSALPFLGLIFIFGIVDEKFAFKVPMKCTRRFKRLFVAYIFVTACISYGFIAILWMLSRLNGSALYGLIAFIPYAAMPVLLPVFLCLANAVMGIFENAKNKKFVERAGQVLDECSMIKVAVVGSYGKTSVKNILKTLLCEKYETVETPESYNTPIGIAKTVFSDAWQNKKVFIAEMGARKRGDIEELCQLVKPDYAIFTGVCEQHIETFGSIENVYQEKSRILTHTKKVVVCGESLKQWLGNDVSNNVQFSGKLQVKDVQFYAKETHCIFVLEGKEIAVKTKLLGKAAIENMRMAALLAYEMGLTAEEIERGLAKIKPIPHRLQLLESGGVYILDDGYNANPCGAKEALEALSRFEGKKWVITPGIIECGVLEECVNAQLGENIANSGADRLVLVGETLINAVKVGYQSADGDMKKLSVVKTLSEAQMLLAQEAQAGDCVLFLNDLPDVY